MSAKDAPAIFTARVNLVLVPVVVRDKNGIAAGSLQKEDFMLTDKGKPQVITRFGVEKTGQPSIPAAVAIDEAAPDKPQPPAEPVPERFVALLFDDLHLDLQNLIWAQQAAIKFLDESLEPSTRVAIFTTSGVGTLDFTNDRETLRETIQRIRSRTDTGGVATDCPYVTYFMADALLNRQDANIAAALTQDTYACAALDPNQPTSAEAAQSMLQAAASRALSVGFEESRRTLMVAKDIVRRLSATPGNRTMVLVSMGFYLTPDHRFDENDLLDKAIRANVTISALDTRGLYTAGADASVPAPPSAASAGVGLLAETEEKQADSDVLAELPAATGGTFFQNDNDLKAGFKQLAAQPEFIYVLGFSPQNLKLDGAYHALKVTLRNPAGFTIQARRGYYAPKHLADPEEQAREELQEAVFSRDEIGDIPVNLNMQFFKASAASAKVTVVAKVDVRNLRYRKAEGRNNDTLTIVSGLFDRNGNWVAGVQKIVDMKLKDETLRNLPPGGISVRSVIDVAPGSYMVRLVVRDSEGQTMAARNGAVQIP